MSQPFIRKAAVAGRFYPANPDVLRRTVADYIDRAGVEPAPERVVCVVAPHAGYIYSGPTAAHAFARVRGGYVKRAVLLGCSHHFRYDGAAIPESGRFETSLGDFPIEEGLARRLAAATPENPVEAHAPEHAIEVHLPFLAVAVGLIPIVPVLFGGDYGPWHRRFADLLAESMVEGDLVVVSTDLSHYLSESQANKLDHNTLELLLQRDVDRVVEAAAEGRFAMCGVTAVATAMDFCRDRRAEHWEVLDYRTSARASGDFSRVVGYAAVSMERAA